MQKCDMNALTFIGDGSQSRSKKRKIEDEQPQGPTPSLLPNGFIYSEKVIDMGAKRHGISPIGDKEYRFNASTDSICTKQRNRETVKDYTECKLTNSSPSRQWSRESLDKIFVDKGRKRKDSLSVCKEERESLVSETVNLASKNCDNAYLSLNCSGQFSDEKCKENFTRTNQFYQRGPPFSERHIQQMDKCPNCHCKNRDWRDLNMFENHIPQQRRESTMGHSPNTTLVKSAFYSTSHLYESLPHTQEEAIQQHAYLFSHQDSGRHDRSPYRSKSCDLLQQHSCTSSPSARSENLSTFTFGPQTNPNDFSLIQCMDALSDKTSNNKSQKQTIGHCLRDLTFRKGLFFLLTFNVLIVGLNVMVLVVGTENKSENNERFCLSCEDLKRTIGSDVRNYGFEVHEDGRCCLDSRNQLLPFIADITQPKTGALAEACCGATKGQGQGLDTPVVQYRASGTIDKDNVSRIQWTIEYDNPIQRVFGQLNYSDSTTITIPKNGTYFVYTRISHLKYGETNKEFQMHHRIVRVGRNGDKKEIETFDQSCSPDNLSVFRHSYYQGAFYRFQESDQLYIILGNSDSFDEKNTKLGLFHVA